MKLAVIFEGASTEHSVSVVSGTSVLKNLDKNKYEITPLYIDKNGEWYKYTKDVREIEIAKIGEDIEEIEKIDNIMEALRNQDVLFPVLHGLNGEDRNNTRIIRICSENHMLDVRCLHQVFAWIRYTPK